jgi:hypothetical protein
MGPAVKLGPDRREPGIYGLIREDFRLMSGAKFLLNPCWLQSVNSAIQKASGLPAQATFRPPQC